MKIIVKNRFILLGFAAILAAVLFVWQKNILAWSTIILAERQQVKAYGVYLANGSAEVQKQKYMKACEFYQMAFDIAPDSIDEKIGNEAAAVCEKAVRLERKFPRTAERYIQFGGRKRVNEHPVVFRFIMVTVTVISLAFIIVSFRS